MNDRQRFAAIMHYQPRDRCLLYDFSFWDETLPEWYKQGLPRRVKRTNAEKYFGLDASIAGGGGLLKAGGRIGLLPPFAAKVIEDRGDHEVVQQSDGVRTLRKKVMGSIPHPESHLLADRASWKKHYKRRLNPDDPRRLPKDLADQVRMCSDPAREQPVVMSAGSLYGVIRNWMGMENASYLVYDDPALFEEMVTTLADVSVSVIGKILEAGVRPDMCTFWEDMCYNAGPLLAPEHFQRYLVPQYKRITGLLRKYGCDVVWVDCDGDIQHLLPMWLEAGVNCMFPMEVGTWGTDPIKYRRQYGKELLMMGGFSKLTLAGPQQAIEKEIRRLTPLVEEGGFIPMPDHRVPPDVPLENYLFYCRKAREIWGKNVDLKPMGADKPSKTRAVRKVADSSIR